MHTSEQPLAPSHLTHCDNTASPMDNCLSSAPYSHPWEPATWVLPTPTPLYPPAAAWSIWTSHIHSRAYMLLFTLLLCECQRRVGTENRPEQHLGGVLNLYIMHNELHSTYVLYSRWRLPWCRRRIGEIWLVEARLNGDGSQWAMRERVESSDWLPPLYGRERRGEEQDCGVLYGSVCPSNDHVWVMS